ncbi:MAG TPA: phenylalanine--tRNA ligase subunit beta [Flavobacteriales bacterium]
MRVSWNILRSLIDTGSLSPQEVASILTSTGLEVEQVEALEPVKGMLQGVVVGHVLECTKHPDADRLSICQVDIGEGSPSRIICGAPNVAAGQKVLVATVGATLCTTDGTCINIKKAKIRGVESHGMICAEDELGLGQGHDGILVLDPAAVVGTPAAEQLQLKSDTVLEVGLTPNRSDALGHVGVARDLAAAQLCRTGKAMTLHLPDVTGFKVDPSVDPVKVTVEASAAAPRYAGLTLTEVQVGPSPQWLQDALKSLGLKPINNVVDVTNYVQHELGQPLHAFDADRLAGGHVVVRMARAGEPFTTLDGKERKLAAEDLVIADAEAPACLAGIFGGAVSGVSETTTRLFLESACFDATTIRRSARRHGLNTDASFRFERGVDPGTTVYALKRAALLLQETAGARIASEIIDIHPSPRPWKQVQLSFARLDSICGITIPPDEVVTILTALDCRIVERGPTQLLVEVPPYRVDVTREVDLAEEILRIHGFDRVPVPERLMVTPVLRPESSLEGFQQRLSLHLSARGFREVMTPSLVNGERTVRLGAATLAELVQLRNPLSTELDVLRPTMLFGLLQSAAHNIARQQRDLRLFERGRTYRVVNGATVEEERTALLLTGAQWKEIWRIPQRRSTAADVKAEIELLQQRIGAKASVFAMGTHSLLNEVLTLQHGKTVLATLGTVPSKVLKAFEIDQPAFYAELSDIAWAQVLAERPVKYQEVSKFPAVRRDLSLLLDKNVEHARLEQLAFGAERKLLRAVDLFDVYEGDKLPAGKKSYALSFTLQDPEGTLTDATVEKAMARIQHALEREAGAEVRS